MKQVFVDTNGWLALNSKRDQFHKIAQDTNKELLKSGYFYITTNFVLDETYTGLIRKVGHFAAVDFGEKIRDSRIISIIHISKEIEDEAWQIFKKYSDKQFSFTDCTSFVTMNNFNLSEAFTNDHHFEQMGFRIFLKTQN
jgi:predicted nucleic acid-binding protein